MERFSSSILDDILGFEITCRWLTIIQAFFSWSISLLQSQFIFFCKTEPWAERNNKSQDYDVPSRPLTQQTVNYMVDQRSLCREEMEAVMGRLGIFCYPEEERLQERLCPEDLSGLFEDKEPSLEELNEAFLVFDVNRDGFIDADELQRVLHLLGFNQATGIQDCKKMITSYDENGDGRIDFNEFVKFSENCLS